MAVSRPPNLIKLTPEEEMAIAHPYLHGTALDRLEEEPIGPVKIDVYNDDINDDLIQGINDVDAARHLLTESRQKVLALKYSPKLKERLLSLIVDKRTTLGRKLQQFINM